MIETLTLSEFFIQLTIYSTGLMGIEFDSKTYKLFSSNMMIFHNLANLFMIVELFL